MSAFKERCPKYIKCGAKTYKIKVDSALLSASPETFGMFLSDKMLIIIRDTLPFEEAREVLMHEIIHMLHFNMGHADASGEFDGEVNVSLLSFMFDSLLDSNPGLLRLYT